VRPLLFDVWAYCVANTIALPAGDMGTRPAESRPKSV
jgi:hypothetical protein